MQLMRLAGRTTFAAALAVCGAFPAFSDELAPPTGEVLLTVSGAISVTNGDGTTSFDQALLDSLPQYSFTTSTIWTEGTATYSGVLLKDLLAAVGATGTVIQATALNDYQISIPVADVADDAPLLAYLADGAPMSVREKGPIWLIYPFDVNEAYRTEQNYARAIWQLDRIAITN